MSYNGSGNLAPGKNVTEKTTEIYLPKGLLSSKSIHRQKAGKGVPVDPGFNVFRWLEYALVKLGVLTTPLCCDCQCGYDTSGVDFSSPVTVTTWEVNGDTYTIDLSADNWSQVADILTNLGFGKFGITVNGSNTVDGGICAPVNSNEFGTLHIDDGTAYGVDMELICPWVPLD